MNRMFQKTRGHMAEATPINRMKGSMRSITSGAWRLGYDTVNNRIKSLININNTKVSENLIQNTNECNNCRSKPPTNNPMYNIADTSTMQNYIKVYIPCENTVKTTQGPQVLLSDGSIMPATHKAELNLGPLLSIRSKTVHIFPPLQSGTLISVGKLYDGGCAATFTATKITIERKLNIFLEGTRKLVAVMWHVHLSTTPHPRPTPTCQSANNMVDDGTKIDLAQWYHTTLFILVKQNSLQ